MMIYGGMRSSLKKMAKLEIQGRLGNNLIQFICTYLFCEKHKINLDFDDRIHNYQYDDKLYQYSLSSLLNQEMLLSIKNQQYKNYDEDLIIYDDNFFKYYSENKIEKNIIFRGYFLFDDLLEQERNKIKNLFKIEYNNQSSNDLFIHYRLGDINGSYMSLPLEYFEEAISKIQFSKGYISSDSINDDKCQFLIKKYNLNVVNLNPYETIMFGKNFNNIILSEGTFSYLIGYFSDAKNIFYNKRESRWGNHFLHGLNSFNFLNFDYGLNGVTLM